MCTQTGKEAEFICTAVKLFQAKCVHHQYWQKHRSALNWLRTKKCQKRRCLLFSILRGSHFLIFFGMIKDEGAGAFPPFSHSWHLKQDDLGEMISIRGRRLHLLLSRKLERKANPSLPTLMPELETKPKKGDEAQTKTNESMDTQVCRSCWHLSTQEQRTKPINAKPKKNYQKQIPYPPKLEIAKAKVIVPKPKAK